ncbi:hypothetical protein HII31_10265 [Pseudocercospora fuligena]|uniref:Uncharacterized protein n=1 Tax=Pseudocercospora fuligena TaxID=685502 RepID=A0A8H6RCQ7_9PEZI|nr:hypothetical protein HII31_10265 [Pseudocercospora fuligena]
MARAVQIRILSSCPAINEWSPSSQASSPFHHSNRMYCHLKLRPRNGARSISISLWTTLAGVATLISRSGSAHTRKTTLCWTRFHEDRQNNFILRFATDLYRCRRSSFGRLRGAEERGLDACYCCVFGSHCMTLSTRSCLHERLDGFRSSLI